MNNFEFKVIQNNFLLDYCKKVVYERVVYRNKSQSILSHEGTGFPENMLFPGSRHIFPKIIGKIRIRIKFVFLRGDQNEYRLI